MPSMYYETAIDQLELSFDCKNKKAILDAIAASLDHRQREFFFRSISNQSVVGIFTPLEIVPSFSKIKISENRLREILNWYAIRHKLVITGNSWPNYQMSNNIGKQRETDSRYLFKLNLKFKKEYPGAYWSDFCFPKEKFDEVMTFNAMAWSSFKYGVEKRGINSFKAFAGGRKTWLQKRRSSWSFETDPFRDKSLQIKQWEENLEDLEREKNIIRSKRGLFSEVTPEDPKKDPREKWLTEYIVNKEWYAKHFYSENIPFLMPSVVAPFGWIEIIFQYLKETELPLGIIEPFSKKAVYELDYRLHKYAKKIPFYGSKEEFLQNYISGNTFIFADQQYVGLWK